MRSPSDLSYPLSRGFIFCHLADFASLVDASISRLCCTLLMRRSVYETKADSRLRASASDEGWARPGLETINMSKAATIRKRFLNIFLSFLNMKSTDSLNAPLYFYSNNYLDAPPT